MATHTGKITKRAVDAWKYNPADLILWDGELKGFGVKANADGSRSYLINYRNKYNQKRRYTIGKHGEKLTADQARRKADSLLADIRLRGFDPLDQRKTDHTALSVNDLLDLYLKSARFEEKAESTRYVDEGRINRHLRPTLGKVMLQELSPDQVRKAFASIRDGKTAVSVKTKARGRANVKGGEGAARMAIRVLRAIINWAIGEGYADTNPAQRIEIGTDGNRETILDSADQYAALFRALDALQARHEISASAADAIRLLALTGARRNEIAALKWGQVDMKQGLLVLPPGVHKTGRRTGKPRTIPLNSAARAIIAARGMGEPEEYVFPPSHGDGPIALSSRLWDKIKKEANLPAGISNHSLRHSLGTLMAVQGAEAAQIMAALGHAQLSTAQRYIHMAKDARVAIVEKHTAGISAALEGGKSAEVVPFDKTSSGRGQ